MTLNNGEDEMNVGLMDLIVIFASSDTMKCFECGKEGLTKQVCPGRLEGTDAVVLTNKNAGSSKCGAG